MTHDYVDMTAQPLYPFGYGLSYTTFRYGEMRATQTADGGYDIAVDVTNTGSRRGDEVVQVYARHPVAPIVQPERQLVAFERVTLEPGQTQRVTLHVAPQALQVVNELMQWESAPVEFLLQSPRP